MRDQSARVSLVGVGLVAIAVLVHEVNHLLNPGADESSLQASCDGGEDLLSIPGATIRVQDLLENLRSGEALEGDTVMNLSTLGAAATPGLLEGLSDRSQVVAEAAAKAIALLGRERRLGAEGARVTLALAKLIRDAHGELRFNAILALGFAGRSRIYAVSDLTSALEDDNWAIQAVAARVLGKIGPSAWPAGAQLERLITNTNPYVREQAQLALDRINSVAPPKYLRSATAPSISPGG